MRRVFAGAVLPLPVLFTLTCAVPTDWQTPVEWDDPYVVCEDRGSLHSAAGLYCTIRNLSAREIVELTIGFDLYNAAGRPVPSFANNSFEAQVSCHLHAASEQTLCTRLDDEIGLPGESPLVSRFRVKRVVFSDGDEWISRIRPTGYAR